MYVWFMIPRRCQLSTGGFLLASFCFARGDRSACFRDVQGTRYIYRCMYVQVGAFISYLRYQYSYFLIALSRLWSLLCLRIRQYFLMPLICLFKSGARRQHSTPQPNTLFCQSFTFGKRSMNIPAILWTAIIQHTAVSMALVPAGTRSKHSLLTPAPDFRIRWEPNTIIYCTYSY